MVLDIDQAYIYLVDYSVGKTLENLKINPRVSIFFSDPEELKGYKINGTVEILDGKRINKKMMEKIEDRKVFLSVERVIRGIRQNKRHKHFELGIPQEFVVYKVKVEEITEIGPQGDFQRKKVDGFNFL